jgi:hypothetical protein
MRRESTAGGDHMEPPNQRYVIIITTHRILRMDTATGDTWKLDMHDHEADEWKKVNETEEVQQDEDER